MLPIAEIFQSPQGEGRWTGTYFTFIRLAGCTVGKPYPKDQKPEGLAVYQEQCTAWDGTKFACDTNYKKSSTLHVNDIIMMCNGVDRICLTGGEPLMHDLTELIRCLGQNNKKLHVETSGTIDPTNLITLCSHSNLPWWLTVSPKHGYLKKAIDLADEIKVLVDQTTNSDKLCLEFREHINNNKVWIQPINDEHTLHQPNLQYCLDLQRKMPKLIVSTQLHKVWNCR